MNDAQPLAPRQSKEPLVFFLIGAERSGTTLLRLMLDHHPEVACLGEFDFALLVLNEDGSEPEPSDLKQRLDHSRQFRHSGLELQPGLAYRQQLHTFLQTWHLEERPRKPKVGATLHFRYSKVLNYWPEARFIHLIRDPRDVAPSVMALGWAGTAWHATERWVAAENAVAELAALVPAERIVHLRFEDLLCRPVETLQRLCRLLEVPYDPLMLSYPAHTTYPAPDPSAAQRWKQSLAPGDVQLVEARAGLLLEQKGYQPSGLPALRLDSAALRRLDRRNRVQRFKSRVNSYGWPLVIKHALASKLRWHKLANRCRREMQEINQQNLR
jgi:hypothetical protein